MTERPAPSLPWRAYERLAMAFGLGSLALICLLWLPFAMVLYPLLPRSLGQALGRRAISRLARAYLGLLQTVCACRFDLDELDRLRGERSLIVAANHPSLLDAVLILSRLPDAVCVMKASLMDNLLFGSAARLARYIRNHAPVEMVLAAREELRAGSQLLIFPEGTRTTDFPLGPCQPGAGVMASSARVPVQTVLIEFSTPYLGKRWPLFRPPELPLHCRVRLGRRFDPPTDVRAFTQALEAYLRTELTAPPEAKAAGDLAGMASCPKPPAAISS
ncbi:MAG: 1-acyl-sn-glycerol-3-phosphate acyltransferase [Hydrogenophaga sp.]|jgi:1-acyl-sn-glycerol-3-phosphate acyltransferase|nr:1-acyl-sn-glycerol-3-phosphate acyltransferase [Hydrogenophaga sp.]